MTNNSNFKFVKLLINRLQKFKHLKDSNEVIESTSKKVQNQLNSIKATALTKYNTAIQEFQNISSQPITPMPKTLVNWWQWYQHLTGLNDVEKAKQNVNSVQEKLLKCQEQRRNIRVEAMAVNNKIQEIHHELLMIPRDNSNISICCNCISCCFNDIQQ